MRDSPRARRPFPTRALAGTALCLLLLLPSAACKRGPSAPESIPEVPMSLNFQGQRCSVVIQIAAGAAGYRVSWTEKALDRAEHSTVTLSVDSLDWRQVLDQVTGKAGVRWDWRQEDGVWVVWVHMQGEKWQAPES